LKKLFLIKIGFLILLPTIGYADSKLTALTQDTTAQSTDLIYKVDNPSGSPSSRSIALKDLFTQVAVSSLNATGVVGGNYGSATQVTTYIVNNDGRLTSSSNTVISLTNSNLQSGTYSNITIPAANVASGALNSSVLVSSFPVNGVTAGTYGSASQVSSVTINAQGLVSSATNVSISISTSNLNATGANGSNFLKSDNTWATPSGGSGASVYNATATAGFPYGASFSTITFSGNPSYPLELLDVKSGAWLPQISNGCVPQSQFEITSSSVNYAALIFQAGTTQYAQIDFELPGYYVTGSTLTFKLLSTATMTITETWVMDAQCVVSGASPGSWGTSVTVSTGTTSNGFTISQESAALTPAGSCAAYQHLWLRLYRNGDATGDAYFVSAEIYEEKNSVSAQ